MCVRCQPIDLMMLSSLVSQFPSVLLTPLCVCVGPSVILSCPGLFAVA